MSHFYFCLPRCYIYIYQYLGIFFLPETSACDINKNKIFYLNSQRKKKLGDLFNQIRKKLVLFVHFKGFNISQKPKSSPLSYFAQKTSLNLVPNWYPIIFTCSFRSDSCSYISNIDTGGYFRSLKRFWDCDFNFVNVFEHHMEER